MQLVAAQANSCAPTLAIHSSRCTIRKSLIFGYNVDIFLASDRRFLYDLGRNLAISILAMKHHPRSPEQDDLLRPRLIDLIDPRHELVKDAVPWSGVAGADRHRDVRRGPA